ncbi:MAG: BREX-1 system phosphatase PglZ type A [Methanospirillaceae archaeon]|nr:BREX-1 system phosphatase PglZ type A [Methanospirillaceae archaeon]
MSILSIEKTTAAILAKFRNLSDFETRKIVFWYDAEQTASKEDLSQITETLSQHKILVHILKDNIFATKKLLEHDDITSSYLVYSPAPEPVYEKNWLLDIQLYSDRFESSRVSDLKTEIGIEGYTFDPFLEKHQKFFASKKRVNTFKKFYDNDWREDDLIKGMITVLSGATAPEEREIIKKILLGSLSEDENPLYEELKRYDLAESFWKIARKTFGFYTEPPTLKKLFISLLITHIDRHADLDLKNLTPFINKKRQENECEIFISGWMNHINDAARFDEYCRILLEEQDKKIEKELENTLEDTQVEWYLSVEAPDIFDKQIIRTIVTTLYDGGKDYDQYLEWIKARKTRHYFRKFKDIYCALTNAIELIRISEKIFDEYIYPKTPTELFNKYTESYYLIDLYYRKFYLFYDRTIDKEILKIGIREQVERQYKMITEKILMKWSDLLVAHSQNRWGIELIDNQGEFFSTYITKILSRNDRDKVAVIISDALRYEIAMELKDVLNKSTNGTIEIETMAGCLPSYTRLGMASLLPHKQLAYHKDRILVDGTESDGIENRRKILTRFEKESVAFSFKEFSHQKTEQARERVKGKRVIYIYHNQIDETGDSLGSEDEVFKAADNAIHELDMMVNRLARSVNISNVIITADHGFLYTRDSLECIDLIETDIDKEEIITSNKRFIITAQKTDLPNTHRFELNIPSDSQKPLFIYTPYADLRFKMAGGGRNFVHGGLSLQEIAIPVLLYNHTKSLSELDRKGIGYGKVGITIIGQTRKITSNPFRITLFQTENVTDKRGPLRCKIALYDNSGERVSDEKTIIADKNEDNPDQRMIEITLTMNSTIKNGIYIIRAIDEDEKATFQDVLEIPVQVDILIIDDF